MWWGIACIFFWLTCSFLQYGIWFADFQKRYSELAEKNYREDMGLGILVSLLSGPIGLVVAFTMSGFAEHGFKIK